MDDIVIKKSSLAYKRLAKIAKPFETFESALNRVMDVYDSPLPVSKKKLFFRKNLITLDVAEEIYLLVKAVYHGKMGSTEAAFQFDGRINPGTIKSYIASFKSMMRGERYTRTINIVATRYFLEQILLDYKKEGLQNAIKALDAHIIYFEAFKDGSKLRTIRALRDEFHAKLGEE